MVLDPMYVRFEENMRVTNSIHLGYQLPLTVATVNCVETRKDGRTVSGKVKSKREQELLAGRTTSVGGVAESLDNMGDRSNARLDGNRSFFSQAAKQVFGWLKERRGLSLQDPEKDKLVRQGPGFLTRSLLLERSPVLGFGFEVEIDGDDIVVISMLHPSGPAALARCAFFDRTLHSRVPLVSRACSLEASMRVPNGIPLGCPRSYQPTL
jgi:hypothetical protein